MLSLENMYTLDYICRLYICLNYKLNKLSINYIRVHHIQLYQDALRTIILGYRNYNYIRIYIR